MKTNYGEVMGGWEGHGQVVIKLQMHAYLSGSLEHPFYCARGIGSDGREYEVRWQPYANHAEFSDESDCCDWDNYTVRPL